jgi:hypothetical protein
MPLAFQTVELKGRLYDRHGLRYIDMTSAKATRPEPEPEPDEELEPDEEQAPDIEDPWAPEPSTKASGACCLPDGSCVDTDEEDCLEQDGMFYPEATCEDVECDP